MADGERLYFTIGPVQTFVAQSRRTRDLWASSYLLSHLADVAMRPSRRQPGESFCHTGNARKRRRIAIRSLCAAWPLAQPLRCLCGRPKGHSRDGEVGDA